MIMRKVITLNELKRTKPYLYDRIKKALDKNRISPKGANLKKHEPEKYKTIHLNLF